MLPNTRAIVHPPYKYSPLTEYTMHVFLYFTQVCSVCKESFDTFYNEAEDEWQFGNCMKFEGKNIHPNCYDDRDDIGPLVSKLLLITAITCTCN